MPDSKAWLQTPLGGYFAAWEQARLDAMLADIFGYNALQLGLADVDLLRANRMPLHICAARTPPSGGTSAKVLVDETALPFASTSLDLALLAHVLEFSASPHHVLREVERVLVAEGSVVICGFNPYSLWGWRRRRARGRGQWPWRGQYLSAQRVRDWLILLGFEIQSSQFGCYAPPVSRPEWLGRWRRLDCVGQRWWPVCGAVWIMHGVKRVAGARLIQPNWREKYVRAKNLSPVARRLNDLGGALSEFDKEAGEKWRP
ncbi:MAG: class I SAM-dependent methyltransferase [Azoarcus sp.]|jgi:SAM-dependent methyltransferase|nr:class I SAM-dependent methyltransferase [Azoarcus sp.]